MNVIMMVYASSLIDAAEKINANQLADQVVEILRDHDSHLPQKGYWIVLRLSQKHANLLLAHAVTVTPRWAVVI